MFSLINKSNWQVLILLPVFLLHPGNVAAQGTIGTLLLYKAAGTSPESAKGIVIDNQTNAFVVGTFSSPTTINGTTLNNAGGWPNIFLARFIFGVLNVPLWIKSPTTDYNISNAKVGSDNAVNSYVAGSFGGTNLTFGTSTLTNNSNDHLEDIFLVKYNPTGTFQWLTQAGGTAADTLGDLVTETNGNCYLTGMFQSPTFSAGNSNLTRQSSSGGDCFIIKYNSSGNLAWMQSGSYARGTCIALDLQTNCYVGGIVLGPAVFNGLTPSNPITTNFLAKYTSTGALAWVRGDITLGSFIRLDRAQNIYTTGTFSNTAQFGPITLANNSPSTIFVAKYDSNGNALWARQFPGLGNETVTGLAIDNLTNCWVSGYSTLDSPSNTFAVAAQFDPNGNLAGNMQVSRTNVSTAAGIASNPNGRAVMFCGSYVTNFTLSRHTITNGGNLDVFAAWIVPAPTLSTTITRTNISLGWPVNTNFSLTTASDLGSGWSTVTNGITTVNGQNTAIVTNSGASGAHFYRLESR